jgi:hypothetical protein
MLLLLARDGAIALNESLESQICGITECLSKVRFGPIAPRTNAEREASDPRLKAGAAINATHISYIEVVMK